MKKKYVLKKYIEKKLKYVKDKFQVTSNEELDEIAEKYILQFLK